MHNNYLTLPVLFLMISNHYPLAFASRFNWLILGARAGGRRGHPPLLQRPAHGPPSPLVDLGRGGGGRGG